MKQQRTTAPTMQLLSENTRTPKYVLMHDGCRVGPKLLTEADETCKVIYGFSNKAAYESFRSNSELTLSPYPLVKGYLRNQILESDKEYKLITNDAKGPLDPTLAATTMATVLEAQESKTDHLIAAYLLTLDEDTNSYRLSDNSRTP